MILGVPGSGKHDVIARFLVIAKRMRKKVLIMGINNQAIDKIFIRLI